jgi:two-component system, OmpR family, response regulator VicR
MPTRILYVEDEPFLSKIVKESLESRGFVVHLVEHGDDVLPAFAQFTPDICVLDIMLPGRDGYSIGQEIRQRHPALPIIYLSAKQQTEDVVKGFEAGGNDYMRKPFSMEELIVRVKNLLQLAQNGGSTETAPETGLRIGKFTFDPVRQTLKSGTQEKQLSFREAQLLLIFAEQPNTTIERKLILEAVWGNDSYFNSRNLDVYITRLREYLRDDDSIQIITLKGVGYRLLHHR